MSDLKMGLSLIGNGNFSGKKTNEDFNNKKPLKEDPNLKEEDNDVKDQTIPEVSEEEKESHVNAVNDPKNSFNGDIIGLHQYNPNETVYDRWNDVILFL